MIDHVKDLNHSYLYNLDEAEGLPDFVKQAKLLQKGPAELMGSNLFADSKNRVFPTHSKADTWLSAAFYEKYAKEGYDKEAGAKVESRLRDMCAFWGVDYTEAKVEKVASTQLAIEYRYDGMAQKTIVVESGEQLEKVAEFVTKSAAELPWEMRREAARQILDGQGSFATVMNQNLLSDLHKTAGYGVGNVDDVVFEIRKRQIYLDKNKATEGSAQLEPLIKMAAESAQNGVVDPDTLDKVATALDALDKVLGLCPKYGMDLNPPEKTLFSFSTFDEDLLTKEAVQLTSGQTVANTFLEDYAVRSFMGEFLGGTPEAGHAKEASAKLTPRQSAKVYNFLQARLSKEAEHPAITAKAKAYTPAAKAAPAAKPNMAAAVAGGTGLRTKSGLGSAPTAVAAKPIAAKPNMAAAVAGGTGLRTKSGLGAGEAGAGSGGTGPGSHYANNRAAYENMAAQDKMRKRVKQEWAEYEGR